jgi:hypothetical protein
LTTVASNPILRQIFEKTILTVPGAVYYLSGALLAVSALAMLFVFLNRNRLMKDIEKVKSTINTQDPNCVETTEM